MYTLYLSIYYLSGSFSLILSLFLLMSFLTDLKITISELPMLTEIHLRQVLQLPLGPSLRLLDIIHTLLTSSSDSSSSGSDSDSRDSDSGDSDGNSDRSRSDLYPSGVETTAWAKTPCIPPYCWHRCASFPQQTQNDDVYKESGEDSVSWSPTPRQCRSDSSGDDSNRDRLLIHPISIGIPAELVVQCVPYKVRNVAPMKPVHNIRLPKKQSNSGDSGSGYVAYEFGVNEEMEYHRTYQLSKFALTFKKVCLICHLKHNQLPH